MKTYDDVDRFHPPPLHVTNNDQAWFHLLRMLAFLSREVGGWAGGKNGGWGRVVTVKTIIICVRLSVWAQ